MGAESEKLARLTRRIFYVLFIGVGVLLLWPLMSLVFFVVGLDTHPDLITHHLTGKVTFVEETKREIGLRHDGIPGKMKAGKNVFDVAKGAIVPEEQPFPGVAVGDEVECTVEEFGGKWIIVEIKKTS
jgi:hypothetical protein